MFAACCCMQAVCEVALSQQELMLLTTGSRQSVRILPPLNVSREEIDVALNKLDATLHTVLRG